MRSCLPLLFALFSVLFAPAVRAQAVAVPAGAASGLSLRCTPAEAEVFIDGDSVGKTPLKGVLPLKVGEHTIRVSRPGFTPFIDVFKAKDGQVAKLEVELVPISGVLRVASETPGARVFVDDKYAGDVPVETELTTGSHTVRVEKPGFYSDTFSVSAVAGQVIDKSVKLNELPPDQNPYFVKPPPPQKWYQKWWVWTIGAVGVAAVATAIIVPVVLSRKDVCDGLDVCVPNIGTAQQGLSVGVRF